MNSDKDIVIVTDYHTKHTEFRWYDCATGEERTFNRLTERAELEAAFQEALKSAQPRGGQVVWIMESTTGWARVKGLLADRARFILANVLQMPPPPKAYRKKSDKLDTKRVLREYLHGSLPAAHQPERPWREARRLVALREGLVHRQTALKNRLKAYFAHETWEDRNFWSEIGMERLKGLIATQPESDSFVLGEQFRELRSIGPRLGRVEREMMKLYRQWPDAQRLDAIRGVAELGAVSIVARIGPIDRFPDAEELIGYMGLAPGVRQSDSTRHHLSIGGGGTDASLRNYLIEASVWARQIPRYRDTYERVMTKRGKKIGRIVVARMLVRSIYKMLKEGVPFRAAA